ncbi:basement membrane-specific heparan sulfate proteoglycan core protein-like [Acanthopagrus latus]|uniref:basement membrane-specific heparan sulfate proteoglycan core protein-like n=1 Tax=Acanthopagrus latus TaxID=8177 RepID=UPI00187D0101|nr:basement membrane-specific heparan sulfate proteoglycan core protein-like [Acanthopagrus latus]
MRGAVMSSTAAAGGFVVFLLSMPVIQGQDGWGVTYSSTEICAFKGSTVEIRCTYRYPSTENAVRVEEVIWFTEGSSHRPFDLRRELSYAGRVQHICSNNNCSLRITDLRESDSAEYKFKFITNQTGRSYTGSPGVTLRVTDLQVQVHDVQQGFSRTILKCQSSCLPDVSSYIWYKSGQKIQEGKSSYSSHIYPTDSYSCALKGREDFPSPPVCVHRQTCNRVIHTDRSICAFKGSSVDISCTYSSYNTIRSKFWFSPERSHQWQSPSQPEDLSEDAQFAGRVQVLESERGRSTLRITDLTESDSAQYHFKFNTKDFEWRSILPGTTLTVTALQVQVTRITVHQSDTEAELKCHSSCSPAARLSYVWFKNGQKVIKEESSVYKDRFDPGDSVSCALKGHEAYTSPLVYALRVPSVLVNPLGDIMEGSSVTLTCSSDANPAANYTWYKENGDPDLQPLSKDPELVFSSIQSSDSGEYYCTAENQLGRRTSEYIYINVTYGPRLPSVSVSPSAEIVEGSSVTLTCSSDANPAANYTWYKENEDSPKASGQIFTITDFRAEHSGNYSCEVQNRRGRNKTSVHLTVAGTWKSTAAGATAALILAVILLSVFLWIGKKKASKQSSEPGERADTREQSLPTHRQDDLHYASIQFTRKPTNSLYSSIHPAPRDRHEEEEDASVEYAAVRFYRGGNYPR